MFSTTLNISVILILLSLTIVVFRNSVFSIKKSSTVVEDLTVLNRDDLLSQAAARQVPSALKGLTAVFGMGTGVTPSL